MDLNVFKFKRRIFGIEFFLFIVCLVTYLFLEIGKQLWDWNEFAVKLSSNVSIALLAGLGAGLIFEIFIREKQGEEILDLVKLKSEMLDSGIKEYYFDFRNIDLREKLRSATNIDMYFTYGHTLVKTVYPILEERMKDSNVKLNIFLLSKENPFLDAFGNLWGKYNELYNKENLIKKIDEVTTLLSSLLDKLKVANELKAKVGIFEINYHPVTYSFYRIDNEIVFCPTKLTEDYNFRPISIIVTNRNETDIYHWCLREIEYIKKRNGALTKIYGN